LVQDEPKTIEFWAWLRKGSGGLPGWRRLVTWALIGHLIIGVIAAVNVTVNLSTAAQVVLIPLSGVFVGLTFAWVANVQGHLQSPEIEELALFKKGGYADYVYTFQLGMLVVLTAIVVWGIAGIGLADLLCHALFGSIQTCAWLPAVLLYASVSFAISTCWQLITATMLMIVTRHRIMDLKRRRGS
jgi:hypothetical protein